MWDGPLGHLTWPLNPPNKKQKLKKRKTNKEGLGPSEGPSGHLTWPLNPPKKKQNQKKKNNERKTRKTTKYQKWAFQLSGKIFCFYFGGSKMSLFWQLGQKSAHPKHTINIGVLAKHFLIKTYASRNGYFWTKNKSRNSRYLFLLFSSLSTTKKHKKCWNPYYHSVLANTKRDISKFELKTWIWKKKCTLFLEKPYFYKIER